MASKFFVKPFVTVPVAPVITGIILHFRFYIRCISLYMNSCILASFPLHFARHFCLQVLPHLSACVFFFLFVFNYCSWPICCNFSVCVYCLIPQHCNIFLIIQCVCVHACVRACMRHLFVVSVLRALRIE
jgi:hypothetical protein